MKLPIYASAEAVAIDGKKKFVPIADGSTNLQKQLNSLIAKCEDASLYELLVLGIAPFHEALSANDCAIVEHLYAIDPIKLLVAMKVVGWGISSK
jgi:hypothetical protein